MAALQSPLIAEGIAGASANSGVNSRAAIALASALIISVGVGVFVMGDTDRAKVPSMRSGGYTSPDLAATHVPLNGTLTPLNLASTGASRDNRLTAYWDSGSCGPMGDDYQADWCGDHKPYICPEHKQVSKHVCSTGWAVLETMAGHGTCCSDVTINGCNYAYFAQYKCTAITRDDRLTAYWDKKDCGPMGDDYQRRWCGNPHNPTCPEQKAVSTSICSGGWANLVSMAGHGKCCSDVTINGCDYAFFAQYACD